MFRMVLVLVENEVVVVMVALVVMMVLAGFIKPSYRAGQAEGCHLYRVSPAGHPGGALPHPGHQPAHGQPLLVMIVLVLVMMH